MCNQLFNLSIITGFNQSPLQWQMCLQLLTIMSPVPHRCRPADHPLWSGGLRSHSLARLLVHSYKSVYRSATDGVNNKNITERLSTGTFLSLKQSDSFQADLMNEQHLGPASEALPHLWLHIMVAAPPRSLTVSFPTCVGPGHFPAATCYTVSGFFVTGSFMGPTASRVWCPDMQLKQVKALFNMQNPSATII